MTKIDPYNDYVDGYYNKEKKDARKKTDKIIRKMTDEIIYPTPRYEIHGLWGPTTEPQNKSDMIAEKDIEDHILACLRITNINLINMQKRLDAKRSRLSGRAILSTGIVMLESGS